MTSLAARLYAAVSAGAGNLAISPHSAAVALTLAAYGARGRTRDEIEAVVAGAGQPVEGGEWVELSSANRLFGQQGLTWQPDLQELLTVVDYQDSDVARAVINAWTSGQTHERIPEIVPDGVLDEETLLVLVNALYLKAAWEDPFHETSTTDADFHLADGTVVQVPTMLGHVGAPAPLHGPCGRPARGAACRARHADGLHRRSGLLGAHRRRATEDQRGAARGLRRC